MLSYLCNSWQDPPHLVVAALSVHPLWTFYSQWKRTGPAEGCLKSFRCYKENMSDLSQQKDLLKIKFLVLYHGLELRPRLPKSQSSACAIFLFYLPWSWRYPSIWNKMCYFMESYFVCFLQQKCVLHTCITSETDSLSFQTFSKAPSSSLAQHFCNNDDNHWNNINHLLISLRRQDICFTQYRSKLRRLSQ